MKQLTRREINDKKWEDHWEKMIAYIKEKIGECLLIQDEHSIGISRNRRFFKVYGAEQSFKFEQNNKIYIKAENTRTGKLVKVYEYRIFEKEVKRCTQAHIIHNQYSEEELSFLKSIKNAVVDYYRPNSIKFITDNY